MSNHQNQKLLKKLDRMVIKCNLHQGKKHKNLAKTKISNWINLEARLLLRRVGISTLPAINLTKKW